MRLDCDDDQVFLARIFSSVKSLWKVITNSVRPPFRTKGKLDARMSSLLNIVLLNCLILIFICLVNQWWVRRGGSGGPKPVFSKLSCLTIEQKQFWYTVVFQSGPPPPLQIKKKKMTKKWDNSVFASNHIHTLTSFQHTMENPLDPLGQRSTFMLHQRCLVNSMCSVVLF